MLTACIDKMHQNAGFEYNLIPFPPMLKNRVGSLSAIPAGNEKTCERGKEPAIINQQ